MTTRGFRFRLSLKQVGIGLIVVGIAFKWAASVVEEHKAQCSTMLEFQRDGASVRCVRASDHIPTDSVLDAFCHPIPPIELSLYSCSDADLEKASGIARLARLDIAPFGRLKGAAKGGVTEAGLSALARNKELESLFIGPEVVVSDAELSSLPLRRLRELSLVGTRLSASALSRLGSCDKLVLLRLYDVKLSGSGFSPLRNLSHLETLCLYGARGFDDPAIEYLLNMKSLRSLDLSLAKITDAGMRRLAHLRNLRELSLNGVRLTDAGLKCCVAMTRLEELQIEATGISDSVAESLAQLPSLRVLWLVDTHVLTSLCDSLRQRKPGLRIEPP